jgi:hypothetical protein
MVRSNVPKQPLPRIQGLSLEERLDLELALVNRSIDYARENLGSRLSASVRASLRLRLSHSAGASAGC